MGTVDLIYVIERIEEIVTTPKKEQDEALSSFLAELVYNLEINRKNANDAQQ